ncbi:MAG: cation diffusion facilitator family transporter [Bacteroidales bacterium]|jgi:cation diffusion facilitator family transporter|nr:cation diffusion facilitator family transporter [Bacteroidales bacterium]
MNKKVNVARLSVCSNTTLIILKVIAGFLSGSVSILSEAIHSLMDLLASVVAFFSVRISDTPADENHPYGHGKFENISGVIEAMLIFVAAFWIIFEAVKKIVHPQDIEQIGVGLVVMIIAAIVNIFVSRRLYLVSRETGSIALEADALHLKTDVYTSLGVATGLALMWISGIHLIDPIIAIFVALLILKESFDLFSRAYAPLLDQALPASEVQQITAIIQQHCKDNMTFHKLRSRKAGNYRYIDFHLNLDPRLTVGEAHAICDQIEDDIKNKFEQAEVTIHVEDF